MDFIYTIFSRGSVPSPSGPAAAVFIMPATSSRPALAAPPTVRYAGSPPGGELEELIRQAKEICALPIARFSFAARRRPWFLGRFGRGSQDGLSDDAFVHHALKTPDEPLIVTDATADPRFAADPAVTGEPKIRFYAGFPLRSPEGRGLGTLSVMDHAPRRLAPAQVERLRALAQKASLHLSLGKDEPAGHRSALGFGAAFAVLVAVCVCFVVETRNFLSFSGWVTHTNEVINQLDGVLFALQAAESSQRGYTATGDEGLLVPYEEAMSSLPERLARLRQSVRDNPVQTRNAEAFAAAVEEKLAVTRERVAQRRELGGTALEGRYLDGRGRQTMTAALAAGQEMIAVERELLQQRTNARDVGLRGAMGVLLLGAALSAGLLSASYRFGRRELRRSQALGAALAQANAALEKGMTDRQRAQGRRLAQHAIARIVAEHASFLEAVPYLCRCVCENLDWRVAQVWDVKGPDAALNWVGGWHRSPDPAEAQTAFTATAQAWGAPQGGAFLRRAWVEGVAVWEHDGTADQTFLGSEAAQAAKLRRAFAFPLRALASDQVSHLMVLLDDEPGAPDAELTAAMEALTAQVAHFCERCLAQAALRASQARFVAFVENAPTLAYIKDEEGRMVYANRMLLRHFGLRRQDCLGKTDQELWPEAAARFREQDRRALAADEVVEVREAVRERDGSVSHWRSYRFPLREEPTGRRLLAGMSIDVTARERAEADLRTEQRFLGSLLERLPTGVVACGAEGRLTHCNQAARALLGLPVEGPIPPLERWSEHFILLAGAGPMVGGMAPLSWALRGEMFQNREFWVRPTRGGPERAVSITTTRLTDGDGRPDGAMALLSETMAGREGS